MKIIPIPVLICLLIGAWPLHGATIQWGGSLFSTFHFSDGTQVSAADTPGAGLTFALGTFDETFEPSEANLDDWSDNWNEIDTADFSLSNQYFTKETKLEDGDDMTAGIQFNGSTFSAGEDVYIWAYNSQSVDQDLEWALILGVSSTDTLAVDSSDTNWEVPDLATVTQGTYPLEWRVSTANTAVFGSVGSETGGGTIFDPETGEFQFATVPEPSALILTGFFAMLGLVRRNRRR